MGNKIQQQLFKMGIHTPYNQLLGSKEGMQWIFAALIEIRYEKEQKQLQLS
jgi:hypothetical protein